MLRQERNSFGNLVYIDSPSTWEKVLEQWDGVVNLALQEIDPNIQAVVAEFLESKIDDDRQDL
jgi:hypothetical protein